jgi:hypothetical protein
MESDVDCQTIDRLEVGRCLPSAPLLRGFALEKRGITQDMIRDAFDFAAKAERRAMGDVIAPRAVEILRAIESLRPGHR